MAIKPTAALAKQPGLDPNHRVDIEPSPRRVRVVFNGKTVADSTRMKLVFETRHLPVYYFPRDDVRMDLLSPTDHATHCPYKGDASYWTVTVGNRSAENAVWGYLDPIDGVGGLKDLMAFYWDKMDHWYEEDEEVLVHARDPYSRVDVIESRRQVQVILRGEIVADTTNARFLFETGLPTRYYIPAADVRTDILEPSDTTSQCPYKGTAHYHTVRIGDEIFDDAVWYYPDPIAECPRIKDYLCFYNERVDAILLDGEELPKPRTKWSTD